MELYTTFSGRINRSTFWLRGVLLFFIINAVAAILDQALGGHNIVTGVVGLILLIPGLAISIKRWHDRDKSGWWVLIALIPIIGWLWALIETGFLAGTPGPNRFGSPQS